MVLLIIGAILNFYTNDVVIKRADSTFIPYLGMEVLDEDTVIVKDSSKAEILYSDSSKLFVDENSTLSTTSGKKRSVFLSLGRIWAKVKGLVKGESFEVSNPVSVSGVRGTEFTVSYKDDEAEVKVLSGKVNIRELATGSAVLLERERMAQVKRGMAIEVRKFKIEEIKRWYRWKEDNLKILLKKIGIAIQRGDILKATLLIDQGYALARRLGLTDEYRSKIDQLKEEYETIRKKQGTLRGKIQNIRYTIRKTAPLFVRIDAQLINLKGMVDQLSKQRKELGEFIREHKKEEAIQLLSSINFLIDQIERRIKNIPRAELNRTVSEIEKDYQFIKQIEREKWVGEETRDEIETTVKRTKDLRDRVRRLKVMLDKTIFDYDRLREDISRLKRNI